MKEIIEWLKQLEQRINKLSAQVVRMTSLSFDPTQITVNPAGALRVSQLTTLADLKILNVDKALHWQTTGTGTLSIANNKASMSVTAGQYLIRQTYRRFPYFSGKVQTIEETCDNFQPQAGYVKRYGYFSSNAVAPFNSNLDGAWLETDDTTIYLVTSRNGTETLRVALANWSGYANLAEYQSAANWQNFTVAELDFLWLGGAILQLWIKTSAGFVLAHQFDYAGTAQDVFMLSPNQPVRIEIRAAGGAVGTGTVRYICTQVATGGSIEESGDNWSVNTGATLLAHNTIGTTYGMIGIRKATAQRDAAISIDVFDVLLATTNDLAIWSIQINPTISAPAPAWTALANTGLEYTILTGAQTVTTPGYVIASGSAVQGIGFPDFPLRNNFLSFLPMGIDNTQIPYYLCLKNITGNINSFCAIGGKQHS